jgi:hypothetical protein
VHGRCAYTVNERVARHCRPFAGSWQYAVIDSDSTLELRSSRRRNEDSAAPPPSPPPTPGLDNVIRPLLDCERSIHP